MSEKIVNIMDGNFIEYGGNYYSPHMSYERFGYRFTSSFSSCNILARSFKKKTKTGYLVTGGVVKFTSLGEARGVFGFIINLLSIIAKINISVKENDIVLLRFPGNIAILSFLICLVRNKDFHVELVADPEHYFSSQVCKSRFRHFFMFTHCYFTRLATKRAKTTRYVTESYLQKKYPSTNSFGFSDVYLDLKQHSTYKFCSDNSIRLVNVSMMHNESKGIYDILYALKTSRSLGLDVTLKVIGDGHLKCCYERWVQENGLENSVTFLGVMSSDEIYHEICSSSLYVLASYQEGMPRALLEAMSIGIPVIATNCGGVPEIVPDEFLFEPGDTNRLLELIVSNSKSHILRSMSEQNINTAKRFLSSHIDSNYHDYFTSIK